MSTKLLDILLVDDDPNDCALFGIAVDRTTLNIHLQIVTSGEQAIDHLAGRGIYADRLRYPLPDLAVLDLEMRLVGGLDFLAWRRASASFSSLPVVVFSGFAYHGAIETALAMGARAFIAKPLELARWEAVVRQIWSLGMKCTQTNKPAIADWRVAGRITEPRFLTSRLLSPF